MDKLKSSKVIAIATTAFLVASLVWLMNTTRVNATLEGDLQKEKLNSESLLSEKLLLERDLQKIKSQLTDLQGRNANLDNLAKSTAAKLASKEAEFSRIKKENQSLAQIKKQRLELIALQNQLQNELQSLRTANADLEAKNSELSGAIASLEARNRQLTDDLSRAMFASVDQSQVQAVKGKNEKLTIKANRAKKLVAAFEVPVNLKNLTFRITDAKGNLLTSKDGTIASTVTPSEKNFTASAGSQATNGALQKVEMVYIPKGKLKTGVYTVEILNENLYVGSLKVKLR